MKSTVHECARVLSNIPVGPGTLRMGLSCHQDYKRAVPGQFVMVRLPGQFDPLLPRPFSIHRLIKKSGVVHGLEILYKVVGRGTQQMSLKQAGDKVDLMGPIGNGFKVPAEVANVDIVAGGIGVAPMLFLLSFLKKHGLDRSNFRVFLGGQSKSDLLCLKDFASIGVPVHTTTDDGSSGDQCLVTEPLEIAVIERRPDIIFACGPVGMLTCIAGIANKHGIACQVSIETMMACGMGACLGCAVASRKHPEKYLHACLDGPVFDVRQLQI